MNLFSNNLKLIKLKKSETTQSVQANEVVILPTLPIVEVKDSTGQVLLRHTEDFSEVMRAMSQFQENQESFSASSKNLHFKNDFCPLPKMLTAVNQGFKEVGLVQTKHVAGKHLVTTNYHLESKQFVESWSLIPSPDTDVNRVKSMMTGYNRYITSTGVNLGSEVDDDQNEAIGLTPKSSSSFNPKNPWLNWDGKRPEDLKNIDDVKRAIKEGKVTTIAQIETKYNLSKEVKNILAADYKLS